MGLPECVGPWCTVGSPKPSMISSNPNWSADRNRPDNHNREHTKTMQVCACVRVRACAIASSRACMPYALHCLPSPHPSTSLPLPCRHPSILTSAPPGIVAPRSLPLLALSWLCGTGHPPQPRALPALRLAFSDATTRRQGAEVAPMAPHSAPPPRKNDNGKQPYDIGEGLT